MEDCKNSKQHEIVTLIDYLLGECKDDGPIRNEHISLDKMKELLKESADESKTFGDFYNNAISKIYELGYYDGKNSDSVNS